jgi:type IV fimbrial biogenesis protein FimT
MVSPAPARGFTLPELMVVLAVLAILSAMAAPSFSGLVGTMRARATSSDLYASLSRTRSEAIKRNVEVSLVPGGSAGHWQDGWHIADPADGHLLDAHLAVPNGTVTGPASVTFLPNGRVKNGATPSFDISVSGQSQHRCVKLDLSGRPLQSSTGC